MGIIGKAKYLSASVVAVLLCSMLAAQQPAVDSLDRNDAAAVVSDSASRIIRVPAQGRRVDRGIFQYLFIPKGGWFAGAQISYAYFSSSDSEYFLLLKGLNASGSFTRVTPFIGYFYHRNQCLGVQFAYRRLKGDIDHADIKFGSNEDYSFSLSDVRVSQRTYSAAMFHRAYIGLEPKGRFALYNETRIEFASGRTRFSYDENYTDMYTRNRQTSVTFHPGLAVFVMNNMSIHASIGVGGVHFNSARIYDGGGVVGKRSSVLADFRLNLTDITVGMTLHL